MVNLLLSLNNFDENWCYSILKDIIKEDKLYWWVCLWQQASNPYVLNNSSILSFHCLLITP